MLERQPKREINHLSGPPLRPERSGYGLMLAGFVIGMLLWIAWTM